MVSNYPTTPVVFQAKPALPRKVNEPPDQLRRMERTFVTEHTHPLHKANAIKTLSPLTQKKRDLGEQIRKQVTKLTSLEGGATDKGLDRQIEALERLCNNVYAKKYPRTYESTATGLTAAQCSQVLSSEFLQYLNEGAGSKKK